MQRGHVGGLRKIAASEVGQAMRNMHLSFALVSLALSTVYLCRQDMLDACFWAVNFYGNAILAKR